MSEAQQRVALVTGANRGLGFETARQLASDGIAVLIGARDLAKGEEAAARLTDSRRVTAIQLDCASETSVRAAAQEIRHRIGRLDILVNNAAVHYDTWQTSSRADLKQVEEALSVNLLGAWRTVVALRDLLVKARPGVIVNVSSGGGALESIGASAPAYAVSKAALNALTISLAADLEPHGVKVNAVCPGWVATDMGGAGGRPVADGAAGIVWAATLDAHGPTGQFFRDCRPISW
jgi:NAD(P)-dependent dehydrogenase (short-subunit alcohol dehydrogenase family)